MKSLLWLVLLFAVPLWAQCPGEDAEPAISVKTGTGPTIFLCGFEDREVSRKGKRAFADFTVYYSTPKQTTPQKVFSSEPSETYWVKAIPNKAMQFEELWFFSEKPQPAIRREVTCNAGSCQVSDPKCVLKMKSKPFPKALAEFQKRSAEGSLKDDGEDLIDQIFAEAFTGDKAAKEFYAKEPAGLDPALLEAFSTNRKKLEQGCKP